MKRTKLALWTMAVSAVLVTVFFCEPARAQPSAAQLKALEPKNGIVSFTWHHPGKREWSSTYKKYVWSIYWTAKRKTDQPGVTLTVKGYSSFDIIGGKYVYWRDFVSGNSYDGQKPPTLDEINQTIQKEDMREFSRPFQVGEWESLRLAPNPDWEWHTMNSVSFTAIGVYRRQFTGKQYDGETGSFTKPANMEAVDRLEAHFRLRLYRDGPSIPWRAIGISDRIPSPGSRNRLQEVVRLLDRKLIPYEQSRNQSGPTRPPVLTQ